MKNKIIVTGGGPAGMMAAISAASSGGEVTLIEKNDSLGKKLLLTGGGRCNLTNDSNKEEMIDHFSGTGDFLRDAFGTFGKKELLRFFSRRGLITMTEGDGRVFPITDKASSVLIALKKELLCLGVRVLEGKRVKKVVISNSCVRGVLCADGSVVEAEKIILACGGMSYRITGSTGDGIRMAERTGHRIVAVRPGLVPLFVTGKYPAMLEGLTLDGVKLIFRTGRTRYVSRRGSIIFTRKGISGPVTLSSSMRIVDWLCKGKKVTMDIDISPGKTQRDIDKALSRELSSSSGRSVKNVLRERVPARLADVILKTADIPPGKKAGQVTARERKRLSSLFKEMRFDISGSGTFEKAHITRGGVSIRDIDPVTMGSKKIAGLFFAGEMIDINGDCGGYNLQAAFSTGYLAGRAAAEESS